MPDLLTSNDAAAVDRPTVASVAPVVDESWAEGRLVLPGGIIDSEGVCHKTVWVRELTGADEEALCDGRYETGAQLATHFLSRVIAKVDGLDAPLAREAVADMLVGDRDYLLLRLRQLNLGDPVHQVMRCPRPTCDQKVDVDFSISEIPVRRLDEVRTTYPVDLSRPAFPDDGTSGQVILRLPNGRDQEALAGLEESNPGRANTRLFSRILVRLGRLKQPELDEERVRELPLFARREIGDFLREKSPGPDLRVEIQCPGCGADMTYPFDIHGFFLTSGR